MIDFTCKLTVGRGKRRIFEMELKDDCELANAYYRVVRLLDQILYAIHDTTMPGEYAPGY